MAHSAVVIDQFVVIFGGLNKETNNLISNDLYVLCLNGSTQALLPKDRTIIEDRKRLQQPKPKVLVKPTIKENGSVVAPIANLVHP